MNKGKKRKINTKKKKKKGTFVKTFSDGGITREVRKTVGRGGTPFYFVTKGKLGGRKKK